MLEQHLAWTTDSHDSAACRSASRTVAIDGINHRRVLQRDGAHILAHPQLHDELLMFCCADAKTLARIRRVSQACKSATDRFLAEAAIEYVLATSYRDDEFVRKREEEWIGKDKIGPFEFGTSVEAPHSVQLLRQDGIQTIFRFVLPSLQATTSSRGWPSSSLPSLRSFRFASSLAPVNSSKALLRRSRTAAVDDDQAPPLYATFSNLLHRKLLVHFKEVLHFKDYDVDDTLAKGWDDGRDLVKRVRAPSKYFLQRAWRQLGLALMWSGLSEQTYTSPYPFRDKTDSFREPWQLILREKLISARECFAQSLLVDPNDPYTWKCLAESVTGIGRGHLDVRSPSSSSSSSALGEEWQGNDASRNQLLVIHKQRISNADIVALALTANPTCSTLWHHVATKTNFFKTFNFLLRPWSPMSGKSLLRVDWNRLSALVPPMSNILALERALRNHRHFAVAVHHWRNFLDKEKEQQAVSSKSLRGSQRTLIAPKSTVPRRTTTTLNEWSHSAACSCVEPSTEAEVFSLCCAVTHLNAASAPHQHASIAPIAFAFITEASKEGKFHVAKRVSGSPVGYSPESFCVRLEAECPILNRFVAICYSPPDGCCDSIS